MPLADNTTEALPERTTEMRGLMDEYFDLLYQSTKRVMTKLVMVKTSDVKDAYSRKEQKPIPKSSGTAYIKIK